MSVADLFRSISPAVAAVNVLKEHGQRQLRGITHADIRDFRAERLAKPSKAKKQRSIAAVNRELEKLRRLLNIAEREGWLLRNLMRGGDPLISIADERKRERILTATKSFNFSPLVRIDIANICEPF